MIRIAQNDHPYLLEWLNNAAERGGSFIKNFATACRTADHERYPVIRGALLRIRSMHPEHEASESVKRELAEAVIEWRRFYSFNWIESGETGVTPEHDPMKYLSPREAKRGAS